MLASGQRPLPDHVFAEICSCQEYDEALEEEASAEEEIPEESEEEESEEVTQGESGRTPTSIAGGRGAGGGHTLRIDEQVAKVD